MQNYQHLGPFSDLVQFAGRQRPLFPATQPGKAIQEKVRQVLAFAPAPSLFKLKSAGKETE